MLKIKKSETADTRSAKEKVTREQLVFSSQQHIGDVNKALHFMSEELLDRAIIHDITKISHIDEFFDNFKAKQEDDSLDFKKLGWFEKHVTGERHHLNDHCPEDVNLFDVMERICDITMAGMARTGTIYDDTLDPEILTRAYKNTIELLKSNIEVEE